MKNSKNYLAALIAIFDFEGVSVDEFNAWYDTEHIPERLRVPGILSAERWLSADARPVSIVTYDLEGLNVLASPNYRAISGDNFSPWSKRLIGSCRRFWRYEAELKASSGFIRSPVTGMFFLGMNVSGDADETLTRWYEGRHAGMLSEVPGILRARRFVANRGDHKHLALYDLESPDVVQSNAWCLLEREWMKDIGPILRDHMRITCIPYEKAGLLRSIKK